MLKSLSLTICTSLLAFAGTSLADGGKEKITCHHGAYAMFQIEMDWNQGTATIAERIKKQWVPTYRNARLTREGGSFHAVATPAEAVSGTKDCGLDQTLSFELGEANAKGVRTGHANRALTPSAQRCTFKAPPADVGESMLTLKCK